jgi:predicted nucleic acid-binding protein
MYLIDTNILVSEILVKYEQDEESLTYRNFYQQIPLIQRVIPDVVLNEFELYMLQVVPSRYQSRMPQAERQELRSITSSYIGRVIETSTLMTPSLPVIHHAFHLHKRFLHTHYISFTDSLLLAIAKANNHTLMTKDRRLRARAKEIDIAYYETTEE